VANRCATNIATSRNESPSTITSKSYAPDIR